MAKEVENLQGALAVGIPDNSLFGIERDTKL
jgi:hypothetical protein